MNAEKLTKELFDFIAASPSAYHTVENIAAKLKENGYTELFECNEWNMSKGGSYFVRRNGTSIIAFRYNGMPLPFMICASHSDSPAFRVKISGTESGVYDRIGVEGYGGGIMYSWFDRPLSIAGRAVLRTNNGVEQRLVNIDRDLAVIPSVAIHMNRTVNEKFSPNPATDMLPLVANAKEGDINALVADTLGVDKDTLLSHDLFLYNRDYGRCVGAAGEFIIAPRLDDLACVYTSLAAFLSAKEDRTIPVLAVFDNEEVGSQTKQGAASTFLSDTLERIIVNREEYFRAIASSFMVSADNAHAKHPNHPELSDAQNSVILGGGVVIKYNANQKYTTDALSAALFKIVCEKASVKTQDYYNRADIPGGSTLGSISNTKVSLSTVDIGIPQLAMHSANETASMEDVFSMYTALDAFYSTYLNLKTDKIVIK